MSNGTHKAYAAIWVAPVAIGLAAWLYWSHGSAPSPASGSGTATPASRGPVAAGTPVPAATVAVVAATPKPAPRILPVSNAFTTLDDYRRRRAAAPQTAPPLVPPPAGRTPETELGRVGFMVRDYRAAFGANPVGNNREITRALMGNNERNVKFLDPATANLDAKGELLDAWGRPYFFHALSGTVMEIRSAGPDGKVFTGDDLVR